MNGGTGLGAVLGIGVQWDQAPAFFIALGLLVLFVVAMGRGIRRDERTRKTRHHIHPVYEVENQDVWRAGPARYLGGDTRYQQPVDQALLVGGGHWFAVEDANNNCLLTVPFSEVTGLLVETNEEARQRLTVTRLALVGIFALALPKTIPGSILITVETHSGPLLFESRGTTKSEVIEATGPIRARIPSTQSGTAQQSQHASPPTPIAPQSPEPLSGGPQPPHPPANTESARGVADELMKLASLHEGGHLTLEEFQAQKRRLLS